MRSSVHRREYFRNSPVQREQNIARASARSARLRFGEAVDWRVFLALREEPCMVCGKTPSRGVDHIVPRRLGGRNVPEQLLPMCRSCNSRKSARERKAALRMAAP
jgi:5-methylcytosine-specific restriction endonuclease McrA